MSRKTNHGIFWRKNIRFIGSLSLYLILQIDSYRGLLHCKFLSEIDSYGTLHVLSIFLVHFSSLFIPFVKRKANFLIE